MTTPQTAPAHAECEVAAQDDSVAFVHNLGGPVDVVGYTAEGDRVGVIATEITENEVEVIVVPGTVRLSATLTPPE